MKHLIVVAALMVSTLSMAAQCEGLTKTGERCKREAAEGSTCCIGHADQVKKPAATAKEKDDGQCWAVTEAGTRCKHKKDGEKDYCKQHAADKKVEKTPEQCRAMTFEGKQCTRKPAEGSNYCAQHKGK